MARQFTETSGKVTGASITNYHKQKKFFLHFPCQMKIKFDGEFLHLLPFQNPGFNSELMYFENVTLEHGKYHRLHLIPCHVIVVTYKMKGHGPLKNLFWFYVNR